MQRLIKAHVQLPAAVGFPSVSFFLVVPTCYSSSRPQINYPHTSPGSVLCSGEPSNHAQKERERTKEACSASRRRSGLKSESPTSRISFPHAVPPPGFYVCIFTEASRELGQLTGDQGGNSDAQAASDIVISQPLACPCLQLVLHSQRVANSGSTCQSLQHGQICLCIMSTPIHWIHGSRNQAISFYFYLFIYFCYGN